MYRTEVDQIEVHPNDGSVTVRFLKLMVDDATGRITPLGYHRSSVLTPGTDVQQHLDEINRDLVANHRLAPVTSDAHAEIHAVCRMAHTPERVAAFKKAREAAAAEQAKKRA